MFPRHQRFNHHTFTACYKAGRRIHLSGFMMVVGPSDQLQVAVVISKKICPLAVTRNRWRRVVYHAIKSLLLEKETGAYIVILKKEFVAATKQEQKNMLEELGVRIQKSGVQ